MAPTAVADAVAGRGTAPAPEEPFRSGAPSDYEAIVGLLEASELPPAGVDASLPHFVVADTGEEIVGVAGLEVRGSDGVLRSVRPTRAKED